VTLPISNKNDLILKSLNLKERFLKMYYQANAGHLGSSLSCLEILTFTYFKWMNNADELILSKGHAAASLYSLLAEDGILTEDDISTFYKDGTLLAAHPPANKIPKIPFATGSLGHGLGLSAGMALASNLKDKNKNIFCVTSDGELNEGSIWEAAMFIVHHQLKNVIWLIDRNSLQGFGRTEDVLKVDDLYDRLTAFGFDVASVNGHDFEELNEAKNLYSKTSKPFVVICNTIKGRGWKKYENTLDSHYLPIKKEDYIDLLNSIQKERSMIKTISGHEK
jgi:transketolase